MVAAPRRRPRRGRSRLRLHVLLRRPRHQRSALLGHVPALLRRRSRAPFGHDPAAAARPLRRRRRPRARRPARVGGGGPGHALAPRSGLLIQADVPPRRLALREARLRGHDGAVGAARRALPPRERLGDPRALLRRLGLRVGEPLRSRQGGRGEGRRLHDDRAPALARAAHPRRVPRERGRPRGRALAKWRRERRLPIVDAARRAALQRLGVVGVSTPTRSYLRHPRAALGPVPVLRVAAEGRRGARARGASLVRATGGRATRALAVSALGLGWVLFHGAPRRSTTSSCLAPLAR